MRSGRVLFSAPWMIDLIHGGGSIAPLILPLLKRRSALSPMCESSRLVTAESGSAKCGQLRVLGAAVASACSMPDSESKELLKEPDD